MEAIILRYAKQLDLISQTKEVLNSQEEELKAIGELVEETFRHSGIGTQACACKIEGAVYLLEFWEQDGSLYKLSRIPSIN